jgi:DNA-binding protein Fis
MFLISRSEKINRIYQTLASTKELFVSSIIYGEAYTGKKSLVKKIYNNSLWVDGNDLNNVKEALKNSNYVVIINFDKILNYDELNFENINVVAISNSKNMDSRLENLFAFIYNMPSLKDRVEDIELYKDIYKKEAINLYDIQSDVEILNSDIDISKNLKSLKSSVYKSVLLKSLREDDISYLLYNYYLKNFSGNNVYKKQLEVFEKALISAGLDIHKSQLKLSDVLGINRNTLRKKINEYY